jgi:O-antigen/teichoic acid export membrane protein
MTASTRIPSPSYHRRARVPDTAPASIRRNTLVNLAGAIAPIGVSLVTFPLYLDVVGETRFGILALAWLVLGYFGAFDLGVGRAVANRVAAAGEERGTVVWTGAVLNVTLGLGGAIVALPVAYVLLAHVVGMPDELRHEAVAAVPFLAAATPFAALLALCTSVLEGLERFVAANLLVVGTIAVYQVAPLLVAHLTGSNLTWLLATVAAAPAAGAVLGVALVAPVAADRRRYDAEVARRLLRYGRWVTVTAVVAPLLLALDRVLIGAVSGARAVALYTVPHSVVTRLSILPWSLARTLFPRFSVLPREEGHAVAVRAVGLLALVTAPVAALAFVLSEPLLEVWIGDSIAAAAAPVAAILVLGVWVNGLAFVPFTLLQAQGRPDLPAKFHLLELGPYAVALWLGLRWGGIEGAAWAWTARVAVDAGLLFTAVALRR